MAFLDHVQACNRWQPDDYLPFLVNGERLGSVRRVFAERLIDRLDEDFVLDRIERQFAWCEQGQCPDAGKTEVLTWRSAPTGEAGFDARSEAMAGICDRLERLGLISHRHGELYPATPGRRDEARFLIDRACAPYFGLRAFGQHINGFVRCEDGLHLWVARRAADRRVYPNHLDHIAAGGLPWGISLQDNLIKECWEEASLSESVARQARPVGVITYCGETERGLRPDTIYCYDLELPPEVVPRCNDDEVAGFELWPIDRVMETVERSSEFKLNCNLVIIDFLIRQGLIDSEHPDYLDLIAGMHAPHPGEHI